MKWKKIGKGIYTDKKIEKKISFHIFFLIWNQNIM